MKPPTKAEDSRSAYGSIAFDKNNPENLPIGVALYSYSEVHGWHQMYYIGPYTSPNGKHYTNAVVNGGSDGTKIVVREIWDTNAIEYCQLGYVDYPAALSPSKPGARASGIPQRKPSFPVSGSGKLSDPTYSTFQ